MRVALAKAVNWDEINQKLYYGTRRPSTASRRHRPRWRDRHLRRRLHVRRGGRQGPAGEGWRSPGPSLTWGLANETGVAKAECNQLQANLGVECEVKIFQAFGAMLDAFHERSADDEGLILGLGWGADNPTLQNMVTARSGRTPGNYIGYSNPEFDKLIAEGNQAQDEATADHQVAGGREGPLQGLPASRHPVAQQRRGRTRPTSRTCQVNPGGFINIDHDHGELSDHAETAVRLPAYAVSQIRGDVPTGRPPDLFPGHRESGVHMGRYVIRRLLQMIPVFFGVTFIMYFLMFALGDPLKNLARASRRTPPT